VAGLPIIRNRDDAQKHNPNQPALVEVPGGLVQPMMFLMETLSRPGDDELGKVVKTMLKSTEKPV
jgi:hypothetical protein